MKPIVATKDSNRAEVWVNITNTAEYNKMYERIEQGDYAHIVLEKNTFAKDHHPKFPEDIYQVN
jgi:hypothetical protein